MSTLTAYEREALHEIAEFRNPERGLLSKAADAIHRPVDKAAEAAFDTAAGAKVDEALSKVMEKLHDAATWTVREDAILKDFREADLPVKDFGDIANRGLEEVEDVIGHLARKYRVLALAEGTAVGAVGAAGFLVDIPLVLGLALRGTTEFAAYYGFYPFEEAEKAYVLDLVSAASSPTHELRQKSMAGLSEWGDGAATGRMAEAETVLGIQAVERIATSIVSRMARGKAAQGVPLLGAFIGGGFNRWFVGQVMEMAEMMYRERFLIRKHGLETVRAEVPLEG
tara:strand:+ start:4093 stop:4941 length:849 start_codon:yes stop_codon:yes gene_type:complete